MMARVNPGDYSTGAEMTSVVQQGYGNRPSQIMVSPTSPSGGVGEVLSNTERTMQSWKVSRTTRTQRSGSRYRTRSDIRWMRQLWSTCDVLNAYCLSLCSLDLSLSLRQHSLFVYGFLCCCKRETKRFEMEVSTERLTVSDDRAMAMWREQDSPRGASGQDACWNVTTFALMPCGSMCVCRCASCSCVECDH
jgi:hypothetical protein